MKQEGSLLAEGGNYRQAISRWRESLSLNADQPEIYEMKAQVLMELGNDFQAVQAAESALHLVSTWWEAHRTLARAQRNLGEIRMALNSYIRAWHLNPWASMEDGIRDEILDAMQLLRSGVLTRREATTALPNEEGKEDGTEKKTVRVRSLLV